MNNQGIQYLGMSDLKGGYIISHAMAVACFCEVFFSPHVHQKNWPMHRFLEQKAWLASKTNIAATRKSSTLYNDSFLLCLVYSCYWICVTIAFFFYNGKFIKKLCSTCFCSMKAELFFV